MRVEVFVDVICPWCYIGARRLEQALEQFDHGDEVEVVWRSFELDPSAPPSDESVTTVEHLAASKRMPAEQVLEMVERVEAVARGEGLECNLEEAHPGNTFDAHRLLHLATARGVATASPAPAAACSSASASSSAVWKRSAGSTRRARMHTAETSAGTLVSISCGVLRSAWVI